MQSWVVLSWWAVVWWKGVSRRPGDEWGYERAWITSHIGCQLWPLCEQFPFSWWDLVEIASHLWLLMDMKRCLFYHIQGLGELNLLAMMEMSIMSLKSLVPWQHVAISGLSSVVFTERGWSSLDDVCWGKRARVCSWTCNTLVGAWWVVTTTSCMVVKGKLTWHQREKWNMKESNWHFDSFRHGFSKTSKIHLICK
jgi:hypothetical protein